MTTSNSTAFDFDRHQSELLPGLVELLDQRLPEFPKSLRLKLAEFLSHQLAVLNVTAMGTTPVAVEATKLFLQIATLVSSGDTPAPKKAK